MAVIGSMAAILMHERKRMREIESESVEIRRIRQDINMVHLYITGLAMSGESVIGWKEADYLRYHAQRLQTDSLLQSLKSYCKDFVRPEQIDTLRFMLQSKEEHLRHVMSVFERQEEADSLLVNHLPEVAKRATRVRTVQQKKKGIAGFFGGKKKRAGTSVSQGTARVQRQPDHPATETGGRNGCIRRQPAHTQPYIERPNEPPCQRP